MSAAEPLPLHLLKEKIAATAGFNPKKIIPFTHFVHGIPPGALIELTGTAKLEWLVQFLKENAELKVFWVEEKLTLLPTALEQRGVSLERFVFVESSDIFKPLRQALKSRVFSCAVTPRFCDDERPLKTLQLLAEEAEAPVFLLAKKSFKAWPLSLQLEIAHGTKTRFSTKILRHKTLGIL